MTFMKTRIKGCGSFNSNEIPETHNYINVENIRKLTHEQSSIVLCKND